MRLDVLLTVKGITRSRNQAHTLIRAGHVRVDGETITKASKDFAEDAEIMVTTPDQYVGRAAIKLKYALQQFGIEVAGRDALDIGSSTGGFSQILLQEDAHTVVGIDVGHNQLAPEIAAWPNHYNFEGFNARNLSYDSLFQAASDNEKITDSETFMNTYTPTLCAIDVSFISVTHILQTLSGILHTPYDVVVLVKPQFEVGQHKLSRGLVKTVEDAEAARESVTEAAKKIGFMVKNVDTSPITGSAGNTEYLLHLTEGIS